MAATVGGMASLRGVRGRSLLGVALLVTGTTRGVAWAQQDPTFEATRRELINQAQQAAARGDHQAALSLATRAGSLRMSPPLRRLVAEEQRATGLLAEALGSAQRCVTEVTEDATLTGRAQHLAACTALVRELEARVGRLQVRPPQPAPAGLEVRIQAVLLASALWGFPTVVTPGTVVVEAQAPGFRPLRQEVAVTAGATTAVDLALEAIPPPPPPPETVCEAGRVSPAPGHCCWPGQALSTATRRCEGTPRCPSGLRGDGEDCVPVGSGSPPPTQPPTGPSALRWVAVGGMVGAGAGIVVGVVGLALRATGLRTFNDGANGCWVDPRDGDVWAERAGALSTCNGAANQVADGGTLAAVGFTVGGVLATASMALWLAAPTQRGERSGRSAGLRCGAGPGALGLTCGVGF